MAEAFNAHKPNFLARLHVPTIGPDGSAEVTHGQPGARRIRERRPNPRWGQCAAALKGIANSRCRAHS